MKNVNDLKFPYSGLAGQPTNIDAESYEPNISDYALEHECNFDNFNNDPEFISNIRSELLKIDLFDIPGTDVLKYINIKNNGYNLDTDISNNIVCSNWGDITMINSNV